jgi:hypothetical protein
MCERDMAEWPCQQAFIRLASAALVAAARREDGEERDEGAGLWPRPFSWRAFYRCEALHPGPENRCPDASHAHAHARARASRTRMRTARHGTARHGTALTTDNARNARGLGSS